MNSIASSTTERIHPGGLTSAKASALLVQFGPNTVASKKKMGPIIAFLKKFNSPLLWIIIGAAVISLFVGQRTNAVILLFMVLLSVVLDFVNSYRSEKAVNQLVSKVVTTATVYRDGKKCEVPLAEIVPDDLVYLSAGDVIPADGVVIDSNDLFVNQSTLTGESVPVEKSHLRRNGVLDAESQTADRTETLMMGTSIVTGYADMRVIHTGPQTSFGKIAERLASDEPPSDFEKNIRQFSVFLMRVTFAMVAIVFILTLVNPTAKHTVLDAFIFSIAIAIGLTPELLPVIITVSLSRGAVRMSKKDVIVKRLPAIQNFGRMSVLCTDKTGTLTENKIAVVQYIDGFGASSDTVLRHGIISSQFHTGVANPLDQAIKEYRSTDLTNIKKVDEIPFDFERRRESMVVDMDQKRRIITKGAPEAVFSICVQYQKDGTLIAFEDVARRTVQAQYESLSNQGFKVLGVAYRDAAGDQHVFEKDVEHDMVFLGFIALLDPPKKSATQAILELEQLGIEVKILTGDGALLTNKICKELNLSVKGTVTGVDLERLSDDQWAATVNENTIFARIDPEQKERIIASLRKSGRVVGFMGDGINDAPALKAADVGVSVNNAVDVAKETADIILLKQSLRVLKDGVIEGRKTFQNAMKYIEMGLSSNFGNMFSMMIASSFLPFLPMLPSQVLLNNFLYDSSQLTLSTDAVDEDSVRRPTVWDIRFVRRFMLVFGPISSLFDFATFGLMWYYFSNSAAKFQTGWFIESIATQVFVIYVIRTKKIPFFQSTPSLWLVLNTVLAVALAWSLPYLPVGKLFGLSPLPVPILLILFGYVVVYLFLVQGVKQWFYRRLRPNAAVA